MNGVALSGWSYFSLPAWRGGPPRRGPARTPRMLPLTLSLTSPTARTVRFPSARERTRRNRAAVRAIPLVQRHRHRRTHNSLPPPLFPGVYNTSETNGFADYNTPNSSVSSDRIQRDQGLPLLHEAHPAGVRRGHVHHHFGSDDDALRVHGVLRRCERVLRRHTRIRHLVDRRLVRTTAYSYTTTSGGASPLIYVEAHAGVNELDSITYAYGYFNTLSPPPPPPPMSTPEPSSAVLPYWVYQRSHCDSGVGGGVREAGSSLEVSLVGGKGRGVRRVGVSPRSAPAGSPHRQDERTTR